MLFNVAIFIVGFAILALQPLNPSFLNPDGKGMLAPTTIFNTLCSFLSNTNLQHYSGEVHLSYGSQLSSFAGTVRHARGRSVRPGGVIRGLRGDEHMGNFYVDLWRGVVYLFLPLAFVVAVLLMAEGMPMTLQGNAMCPTVEPESWGSMTRERPGCSRCSRAGGGHCRHQTTRHQRRRLLRRQ